MEDVGAMMLVLVITDKPNLLFIICKNGTSIIIRN